MHEMNANVGSSSDAVGYLPPRDGRYCLGSEIGRSFAVALTTWTDPVYNNGSLTEPYQQWAKANLNGDRWDNIDAGDGDDPLMTIASIEIVCQSALPASNSNPVRCAPSAFTLRTFKHQLVTLYHLVKTQGRLVVSIAFSSSAGTFFPPTLFPSVAPHLTFIKNVGRHQVHGHSPWLHSATLLSSGDGMVTAMLINKVGFQMERQQSQIMGPSTVIESL
ncbi:hypothetical protein OG21DRAFT_1527877 [Imleria badia]|nr:hypothetical protein OG21DRAFT_1527877 [Imleria badia]